MLAALDLRFWRDHAQSNFVIPFVSFRKLKNAAGGSEVLFGCASESRSVSGFRFRAVFGAIW